MKHINITVRGRVQGVYFRAETKKTAEDLNISGFVKNLSDGNVYLEAEGEDDAIEKLCEWLKQGPPAARVEEVTIEKGKQKMMEGFYISQ